MRNAHRALALACLLASVGCRPRAHLREEPAPPAESADETPRWDDDEIVKRDSLGSSESAAALFWSLWLPIALGVAAARALERRHRRRAEAELAWTRTARLDDGPAVLRGSVETDGGDAITVAITQRRKTFKDKQGRLHTSWVEARREVLPRPFRVQLDDGRAVRVEPDERVLLRDTIEAPEVPGVDLRRRAVRLRPGERVWVSGVLSGASSSTAAAYREGAPTAVLRPGRGERMIVSTEAPGAFHTERAGHHRAWRRGMLWALAVAQLGVLGDYTLIGLSGRGDDLAIERVQSWDVWVKPKNQSGRWVPHCGVVGVDRGAVRHAHEVSCGFQRCAAAGRCQTVPTRRAALTGDALRDVGRGATAHVAQVVVAGLLGWVTLIAYFLSTRGSRPWYAGGKVVDYGG